MVGALVGDLTGVTGVHPQFKVTGVYVAQLPPAVMSTPVLQAVCPPPLPMTEEWAASFSGRLLHKGVELQQRGLSWEIKVAVLTQPEGMVVFLRGKFPI